MSPPGIPMASDGQTAAAGRVPIGYMTRVESFSACHRLHSPALSDEENKTIFGKCNHVNGHGHNYKVEVTARGPISPHTGMVVTARLVSPVEVTARGPISPRTGMVVTARLVPPVEVTARGPISPRTGMVVNIADMKVWIQKAVMDVLDHRNIDKDVPHFRENVSTAENIAVFIWESIEPHLPPGVTLHEIRLHETDKNIAVFRGEYQ